MHNWYSDVWQALSKADPAALMEAGLVLTAGLALSLLHGRFRDKGAAGVLDCGRWLAYLWALEGFDKALLGDIWRTPVLVLDGLFLWLAARAFLHGIYGAVFLQRIKKQPVNPISLNLVSFLAMAVIVFMGLNTAFNVNLGSLLTSSAILTAVVGFSMQDTIGSLLSGLLIQMEKPFKQGDWIKTGEFEGQVTEITWRYTKLRTLTDTQVLIPNNTVAKERLINLSEPIPQMNLAVSVPAPLSTPPVRVRHALEEALGKCALVVKHPAPSVRLSELTRQQATYRLNFYIADYDDMRAAQNEVLSAAWYQLLRQGIDFAVERREVFYSKREAPPVDSQVAGLVAGVGLFAGMRQDELDLLVLCSANRTFSPESAIVKRGEGGATMFIIVSGTVSVRLGSQELTTLGPGEVFGEMALLTGEPRQADVVALDRVACLEVDREAFRSVLEKNPALFTNITQAFKARELEMRSRTKEPQEELCASGLFERFRKLFW